jgi:hypothetical protein
MRLFLVLSFAGAAAAAEPIATHHCGPGWATFGQVVPRGAARDSLRLGELTTQCDVKTRWDDGSIRFAVVTARIPDEGDYALEPDALSLAPGFMPTPPEAAVAFTIAGLPWTAVLPAVPSTDLWLAGPNVVEWRSIVAPTGTDGVPPYLQVIYDVRCYRDGEKRVDVTVENPFDKAGATRIDYDVAIAVDGQQRFAQAGVVHWYLARWRRVFPLGLEESAMRPDFEPDYRARALPRFQATISDVEYDTSGPTFAILQRGGLAYNGMGAPGGRPEIAPYPDWAARFLVHGRDSQRAYVLGTGDCSGSEPFHIREVDGSLVSIDARPQFWLDERGKQWVPISDQPKGDLTATSGGSDPLTADLEHPPSMAYIPYLVTGDRYYADELAFWGNFVLLATHPYYFRMNERGLVGDGTVRAMAWPLRNLTDAAAYLPDAHPLKAYFAQKVANNLAFYDDYVAGRLSAGAPWSEHPPGPLGDSLEITSGFSPGYEGKVLISQWQQNFLAWAIGHANAQGFAGGDALRDRMVAFQLKLFTSEPDYPRDCACPYYPAVGTYDASKAWTPFTTMRQVFDNSINSPGQFAGYYGVDARLSLQSAIAVGLPRAQESLDYLMAQPGMPDDLVSRAGWALVASDVDSGTTGGGTTTTGGGTTASGGGTTAGSGDGGGSPGRCGLGGSFALLALLCLALRRRPAKEAARTAPA